MVKTNQASVIRNSALHTIAVWLIGVILVAVPMFAMRYVFAGIGFQKAIVLYVLVTILVGLYVALVIQDRQFLPRFNIVGWSFLALIILLGVSTIFSIQPYPSFWGAFNRMEGYVSWLYYFAFFVVASSILKTPKDWWVAIKIGLVGALLISLYGLGQALGLQGLVPSLDRLRVESTLGNPVFLGGYLALAIPLTLGWAITAKQKIWRNLAIALVILEAIVLFLTFSRGSWIGGVVGVIVFAIAYFYQQKRSLIKWMAGIAVGLAVIVGIGLLAWGVASPGSVVKAWGDKILRPASLSYRLTNWSVGLQGIAERPLTGWGLENFKVVFDKYYQTPPKSVSFQESHVDRAHNEYVGIAVSGGIPALLAYLVLMISAIVLAFRRLRDTADLNRRILVVSAMGVILAYMAYIFTAFHLMVNVLFFLMALAFLNQPTQSNASSSKSIWLKPLSLIASLGIIALSYGSVLMPISAVQAADKATTAYVHGEFSRAQDLFDEALSKESYMSNIVRAQMALTGSRKGDAEDNVNLIEFRQHIAEILPQNFSREPYSSYHHLIFAMYYATFAGEYDGFLEKADEFFGKAAQLTPGKAEVHFRWGEMYARIGNNDKAREKFETAISIEPYNREINFPVGTWYLSIGETEKGVELIERALDWGYLAGKLVNFERAKNIADILENSGNADLAEKLYIAMIETNEDPQVAVYATVELALLRKRLGDISGALDAIKSLNQYNVDPRELDSLVREIQGTN